MRRGLPTPGRRSSFDRPPRSEARRQIAQDARRSPAWAYTTSWSTGYVQVSLREPVIMTSKRPGIGHRLPREGFSTTSRSAPHREYPEPPLHDAQDVVEVGRGLFGCSGRVALHGASLELLGVWIIGKTEQDALQTLSAAGVPRPPSGEGRLRFNAPVLKSARSLESQAGRARRRQRDRQAGEVASRNDSVAFKRQDRSRLRARP